MILKSDKFHSSKTSKSAYAPELLADFAEEVLSMARVVHFGTLEDDSNHLTATEIEIIRYVRRNPGMLSKAICAQLGLQRSNFSSALRGLKEKDMITSVQDEKDGRSLHLYLTAASEKLLALRRSQWVQLLSATITDSKLNIAQCLETLKQVNILLEQGRQRNSM